MKRYKGLREKLISLALVVVLLVVPLLSIFLLTNPLGQALADLYYKVSPPMAEFITEHPSLKPVVRAGLLPVVALSTVAVNTTPAEKTAIVGLLALVSVALAVWATRRRGRSPEDSRG